MRPQIYGDDYEVMLSDLVEVKEGSWPAEMARVQKIGKGRLYVEWDDENTKPRCEWVAINDCTMIARG